MISSSLAITALSLVTPFLAYQLGERIEASGVLAVVVSGLILGFRGAVDLDPDVRLTLRSTWATVRYVLEGAGFRVDRPATVGDHHRAQPAARRAHLRVAGRARDRDPHPTRLWIFLMYALLARMIPVGRRLPDGKSIVAVSWAGMRGVVSLAAAQTLPLDTPYRPLLLTCTIAVIVGTLVVQGLTLPAVIRALRFPGDPARDRVREKGAAMREASTAIADRVEKLIHAEHIPKTQADRMRAWVRMREVSQLSDGADRETAAMLGDTPDQSLQAVVRWRHELVAAEREVFIRLRNAGDLSEVALRELEFRLDLEEALLDTRLDDATGHLEQLRVVRQDREDEPG